MEPRARTKLRDTFRHWQLWKPAEPVLLAVSGGVDSMVLADLLQRLSPAIRPALTLAHFNHRLRGRASDADERLVARQARIWGIPVVVGRAPRWKSKENLQERARTLRYTFLRKTVRRLGIRTIVTAHHADDQAETFLIRWIQGSGLKGLAGIPVVREEQGLRIVRPLLGINKREILGYAKHHKIPYREDASNLTTDYLRNRVRKILRSLQKLNPSLARTASRNAVLLRADEEFLEQSLNGVGKGKKVPLTDYRALPAALRYRLLRRLFEAASGHLLDGGHLLQADRILTDPAPTCRLDLPHRLRLVKDYVRFRFKSVRPDVDRRPRGRRRAPHR